MVKGAQSDPNYVSRLLARSECLPGGPKIIVTLLLQILADFQISFTGELSGKFATKHCLNIPPHLNCVATLPREISVFQK